jgi:hypothetical protein
MVMDLATAPIRAATSASPTRVLRLAMFVGVAGLVALLAAVGVLVWTFTGVTNEKQQTVSADSAAAPQAIIPDTAEPAPALPAPAQAASLPPGLADLTSPGGAGTAPNAAMPAFTPSGSTPAFTPSGSAPSLELPTVKWPTNDQWLSDVANNVDWSSLFWRSPSGNAATSAIVSAATSTANNAINLVGNSAVDVFEVLLLANLGYYGQPTGNNMIQAPAGALSTLSNIDLPAAPSLDLTKLPPPPPVGLPDMPPPPTLDLTKLPPPPQVGLPKPPKMPSITRMIGLPF